GVARTSLAVGMEPVKTACPTLTFAFLVGAYRYWVQSPSPSAEAGALDRVRAMAAAVTRLAAGRIRRMEREPSGSHGPGAAVPVPSSPHRACRSRRRSPSTPAAVSAAPTARVASHAAQPT